MESSKLISKEKVEKNQIKLVAKFFKQIIF